MWNKTLNVDSYADLKTAVAAFGDASSVFYRFTNAGASIQIWAIAGGVVVGSSNINSDTPSSGTLLTDFPAAREMTASFSPS